MSVKCARHSFCFYTSRKEERAQCHHCLHSCGVIRIYVVIRRKDLKKKVTAVYKLAIGIAQDFSLFHGVRIGSGAHPAS
jgi:hypothetical protein